MDAKWPLEAVLLATVMGVVGAHNIYLSGVVGIIAKALRKLALRKLTLTCGSGGLKS
jgi:TM2 domain-containing membrane protein YozV